MSDQQSLANHAGTMGAMSRFFACNVAGTAEDVLERCSSATIKMRAGIGMYLTFSAILSACVVAIGLMFATGAWYVGLFAGVLWLAIYLALDRTIFASMDGGNKSRAGLLVRIGISTFLSLFITHWALIGLFQSDIQTYLKRLTAKELQELHTEYAPVASKYRDGVDKQRQVLEQREAKLAEQEAEMVRATGQVPRAKGALAVARGGLEQRQAEVERLKAQVALEKRWLEMEVAGDPKSDKCPTCTGVPTYGPKARLKDTQLQASSKALEAEDIALRGQLAAIIEQEAAAEEASASKSLAAAAHEREKSALAREIAEFDASQKTGPEAVEFKNQTLTYEERVADLTNQQYGLSEQGWALWRIASKDWFAFVSAMLLVFFLEVGPTLTKFVFPLDEYDVLVRELRTAKMDSLQLQAQTEALGRAKDGTASLNRHHETEADEEVRHLGEMGKHIERRIAARKVAAELLATEAASVNDEATQLEGLASSITGSVASVRKYTDAKGYLRDAKLPTPGRRRSWGRRT